MHPVVAPSRSSQTRSVLARFLDRPSGNGIFTEVTRLMALRTSSRSAATAEVNATPSNRLATRRDLNGWNMWVKPSVGKSFQRSGGPQVSLFTEGLECNLDAFVIEGLKVAAKLVAATGGAIEKLAYPANRGVRLTFEGGRAPNVDCAIEIEIVDILIGLADQQPRHGLLADAQHLRAVAHRGDMLIAPPDFVIEPQAGDSGTIGVEVDPFGMRHDAPQVFRVRHFHSGNQIDDHPHLLSLSGCCCRQARADHKCACARECLDHVVNPSHEADRQRGEPRSVPEAAALCCGKTCRLIVHRTTSDPREESGALAAHAGICGGEEKSSSLPRPSRLFDLRPQNACYK